jgi:hypothetical protein
LEDFGLTFEHTDGDFTVSGDMGKATKDVMTEMGGRWYKQEKVWHFKSPGKNFEARLARAIASKVDVVDQKMTTLFAEVLAENLSNVIKEHGHRAKMIRRRQEVVTGYETDPQLAYAQYASGIAAGQAKGRMAMGLVRAGTGTDISWKQFQELVKGIQDTPKLKDYKHFQSEFFDMQVSPEEHQTLIEASQAEMDYTSYRNFVLQRRIDPAKQPNAFKAYTKMSEVMLRNQERAERVVGFFKGLAVFKYLAFRVFSAPLINMTAMPTSATAAMSGYGNIPIHQSLGYIAKGIKQYYKFWRGDTKGMDPDVLEMFNEIVVRIII